MDFYVITGVDAPRPWQIKRAYKRLAASIRTSIRVTGRPFPPDLRGL
jgi:hypothetical protein